MKSVFSSRRWAANLFVCVLLILALMAGLMYIVDPYFQFRVRDDTYLVNPQYVNAGLIKNYDYDTLIVGSSMVQNFDMELFRQEMGAKPLHVSLGGLTTEETLELLNLADQVNRAKTYYVNIELTNFCIEERESVNLQYLLNQDFLSTCQYLLCHEAWFYSIPVDICLSILKKLGVSFPESIALETSIDHLGNWEADYTFAEDVVIENYRSGAYAVSKLEKDGMYERAAEKIDRFFSAMSGYKGTYNFIFPPYSGLFWYSQLDCLDVLLDIKQYFIERAAEYGHTVYDFQGQDFISDLNYYKDTTHYSSEINDRMVRWLAEKQHIVTPENFEEFKRGLYLGVERTYEKYADKLN